MKDLNFVKEFDCQDQEKRDKMTEVKLRSRNVSFMSIFILFCV